MTPTHFEMPSLLAKKAGHTAASRSIFCMIAAALSRQKQHQQQKESGREEKYFLKLCKAARKREDKEK